MFLFNFVVNDRFCRITVDTEKKVIKVLHTLGQQGKAQLVRSRHRRVGASEPARTEHPRLEVVLFFLSAQALGILLVEAGLKRLRFHHPCPPLPLRVSNPIQVLKI